MLYILLVAVFISVGIIGFFSYKVWKVSNQKMKMQTIQVYNSEEPAGSDNFYMDRDTVEVTNV